MRFQKIWQLICHSLFILTTMVGWVVPWVVPHYYQPHPIRMRDSTELFEADAEQNRFKELGENMERPREVVQNACRI